MFEMLFYVFKRFIPPTTHMRLAYEKSMVKLFWVLGLADLTCYFLRFLNASPCDPYIERKTES